MVLRGQLTRFSGSEDQPLSGVQVVLHRVSVDSGGAVDSALSGRDGNFQLRARATEDSGAVYFASAVHHGIAYFSDPWSPAALDSATLDIVVFDTTSAPVPIALLGRVFMVSAPVAGGARRVAEVFEVANDSNVTRVAGADSTPVWRTRVPASASEFSWGPQGSNPASLTLRGGEVVSFAPFAPGVRAIFFSYLLPASAFPFEVALEDSPEALEILLEEQRAIATGPEVIETAPLQDQGRIYRRFQATDFPRGATLTITVPSDAPFATSTLVGIVVAIVSVGMTVALVVALRRRAPGVRGAIAGRGRVRKVSTVSEAEALARRIAELDDQFGSAALHTDSDMARYRAEREALKQKLSKLLAREKRRG